ncbi:MAG: hypothetical protein KGI54_18240, partial [Pseudomonadota bacterium]|nr:hypothetical protein [Pseudomonadota bacterium]
MADLTDVLNALIAIAAQAVYPSGTGQSSVAATPVKIYPGWPIGGILDADLLGGTCHISIYPRDEETNTSRYMANWNQQTLGTPTLTATILNNTVTIGGTVSSP